ncbi:MAG: PilZ domain-containing protein [Nitrospirota bacterium]
MSGKRQHERKPFSEAFDCSVCVLNLRELTTVQLRAESLDISDGGIGIQIGYPVEPGHVLRFSSGIKSNAGIVRWTVKHDTNRYKAGIMFV